MKRPLLLLPLLVFALSAAAGAGAAAEPLVTRSYDVLPSIYDILCGHAGDSSGDPFRISACVPEEPGTEEALRGYAAERGVTWPEGSALEYLPASNCVRMRNTEANHALFRDVVARFAPRQVRVRTQFASVAPDAFAALGLEDVLGSSLDAEAWAALRARLAAHPGAELRGCVSMLTETGAQATEKSVVECTFPTEFGVVPLRADSGEPCAAVEPRSLQTREVGEIVQLTARIPGYAVDRLSVDATPAVVLPPVWRDYAPAGFRGSVAQPFFPEFAVAASLDLLDGRTVALGGAVVDEPGGGPRFELAFLTAEVVGLDGRRIPFVPRAADAAGAAPGLVSRRIPVLGPDLDSHVLVPGAERTDPAGRSFEATPEELRAFGERNGVDWPAGSGAWFDPMARTVEIRNTPENAERFRAALVAAGAAPVQIRVRARLAAATPGAFATLGLADRLGGQLSPDEWAALRAELDAAPGVETLTCPSVLARPGSQAGVKGFTEYAYPTEFRNAGLGAAPAPGAPTNAPAAVLGVATEPRVFCRRDVGLVFTLTPRRTAAWTPRIGLDLAPSLVYPPEWRDYAAPPPDAGPAAAAAPFIGRMEQPFFPCFHLATMLDLRSGFTAVLGGSLLDVPGKGPRHHLLFVTAEIVDLEGSPVAFER